MKTVLFVKSSDLFSVRERISGFMSHATTNRRNVQIVEPLKSAAELDRLVRFWAPDGCVVCCGAGGNDFPSSRFRSPVVFLDRPARSLAASDSFVCHDSVATSRLAARELLSLNLAHYAYVGSRQPLEWDVVRRRTFTEALRPHGLIPSIFDADACSDDSSGFIRRLTAWLKTLPRPFGILAATDHLARQVIGACQRADLAIPDECAVIGVDDDPDICEYVSPSLSSVRPDFFAAGRLAAEALDRLMHGFNRPIRTAYLPSGITRRESTRRLQRRDLEVSAALETIRKLACEGLTAKDALKCFTCSRRMAELRFRKAVGRSILEEILAARLERANVLLATSDAKLDVIAGQCGYKTAAAFAVFYKNATGHPPRSVS